jgi:hypothetical protein
MKQITLLIVIFLFTSQIQAQIDNMNESEGGHPFSLGISTGIDNFTGMLGVQGSLKVQEHFSVRAGVGIGSWGGKYSFGAKYDTQDVGGWSFGAGYSYCPGFESLSISSETTYGTTEEVSFKLLSASTANLTITKNWRVGRANTFYLEMRYDIPLEGRRWEVITNDVVLSETAEAAMDIIQPGGLILAIGFAFRL